MCPTHPILDESTSRSHVLDTTFLLPTARFSGVPIKHCSNGKRRTTRSQKRSRWQRSSTSKDMLCRLYRGSVCIPVLSEHGKKPTLMRYRLLPFARDMGIY